MIQTLGDVLVLVTIISVGVVSLLLAVFLYHLVFVVMDLRQVMKRINDITEEIEEMIMKPVEAVSLAMGWLQKLVWDLAAGGDGKKNEKKSRRERRREKKRKKALEKKS